MHGAIQMSFHLLVLSMSIRINFCTHVPLVECSVQQLFDIYSILYPAIDYHWLLFKEKRKICFMFGEAEMSQIKVAPASGVAFLFHHRRHFIVSSHVPQRQGLVSFILSSEDNSNDNSIVIHSFWHNHLSRSHLNTVTFAIQCQNAFWIGQCT